MFQTKKSTIVSFQKHFLCLFVEIKLGCSSAINLKFHMKTRISNFYRFYFRADARASAARQALEKELQIQRQSQIIFEEAAKKRDYENRDRVSHFWSSLFQWVSYFKIMCVKIDHVIWWNAFINDKGRISAKSNKIYPSVIRGKKHFTFGTKTCKKSNIVHLKVKTCDATS